MGDTGGSTTMSRNQSFLKAVFGDKDWEHAHVCAVPGDPSKDGPGWFGGRAGVLIKGLPDTTNNYFCVSLFTGPRRRKNDFLKLVCLVIDDVGPTLDAATVELLLGSPTWIVETSQGNFQWGYVLETGITDPVIANELIHRVRVMLTGEEGKDPGQEAINRYMRLPTGLNLKKSLGGNPWKVRLVKISQGIRLTDGDVQRLVPDKLRGQGDKALFDDLAAGAAASSSTSSSSSSSSSEHMGVHATDTLLGAMRKLGLVLGKARNTAMGWGFDIRCPWVDEHTERAETGTVYVAGAGKFRCQHGHCIDRTVEDVRDKLDEMLRDEGCTGGLIYEEFDVVDPATVPAPPQGIRRTATKEEFFDSIVAHLGHNTFFDLRNNREMTIRELDDHWTGLLLDVLPRVGTGTKQKMILPHTWVYQEGRLTSGRICWPGKPKVFAPDDRSPGGFKMNIWDPLDRPLRNAAETEVDAEAIKLWLEVYWHVVGWDSQEERDIGELVLDWLALVLGGFAERVASGLTVKAGWQVVITGPQGIGKDSVIQPFMATLGQRWSQIVQPQQFGTNFNEWAAKRLVQVSETRQNTRGSITGHDVMNVLKGMFDQASIWIVIDGKYSPTYQCRNVVMGWFTSNERTPLRIEPDDRRFLVIDRHGTKPLSQNTYERLHKWLLTHSPASSVITGNMRVAEFFYRRWERMDGTRKSAVFGIAPMTDAKRNMLSLLIDPIEDWIRRCVRLGLKDPFRFPDIVTAGYVHSRLETAIKHGGEGLPGMMRPPDLIRIGHHLSGAGAKKLNNGKDVRVSSTGSPVVLWAVRDFVTYNMLAASSLAKIYAQATNGTSGKGPIH